ncbi:Bacilysin biosynthesis oxidoreductase YwfH [Variovorax sp. SRS16]|uniref:SDR family oxidoreductase n=1 Tax=Variovorax sp. SRS16 TaxID=282217 RepID=UPI001316FBA1|nr:SDR family oxidoreductase [Variovorax sp. SRS16]VTU12871.1 Bacilysin biosynthesis oxidoreductase YwfH [Variovorax sp. SRS16]
MDLGIAGRTALVLGGTRGLGFACARALAEAGVRVILNGRDAQQGETAAHSLPDACFIAGDIGDEAQRAALIGAVSRIGEPSILVTNAGGPPAAPFEETALAAWRSSHETNVLGPLEVVRAFLPAMRAQRFGRILNITSFVVKELYPNMALSNSLRVGLTGAMGSLAREVAPHGITVNGLLPGLMDTGALQRVIADRMRRLALDEEAVREEMARSIPMQRLGTAEDFGALCAFLASVHASYITGQNICVDGGLTRNVI